MNYEERLQQLRSYYIALVEGMRLSGGTMTPELNKALDDNKHDMMTCINSLHKNK